MTQGDPTVIDYFYLLLRQVCIAEAPCPPEEVVGGDDFDDATEVEVDILYETFLDSGTIVYFHLDDTVDLTMYDFFGEGYDAAGGGSTNIYDGALPGPTFDTAQGMDGIVTFTQNGANGTWLQVTAPLAVPLSLQFKLSPA